MKLALRKLQNALNPAYRKQTVKREEMEVFKHHLRALLGHINPDESEENAKGHLSTFLKGAFYGSDFLIATKERADLVIHNGPKADSPAAVLIETKRPRANGPAAPDMLRPDKPNVKALHELILYFLRERVEAQNTDLKYLIITDIHEFFLFDAADFERLFFKNRQLVKAYQHWRDGRKTAQTTDFFYLHIAQPFVEQLNEDLPCMHFDLRAFAPFAQNEDPTDDYRLIPLFKALAPTFLLRLPFANDSNSLNKDFYYELLYLIGLQEQKEGSKKVIQRKPEGQRDHGSLLENTIRTLQTEERLLRISQRQNYGDNAEEQLFGIALELAITWVNRILFLKLLEAQLLQYHLGNPAYRFLHPGMIKDYDDLNELFFEVLAKMKSERSDFIRKRFALVPYLNSSLFEISPLESDSIRINSLKDRLELPLFSRTVLKDDKGRRRTGSMPALAYFFEFLDAYNFSSEGAEAISEDNKTLINASVLGLIFEKINGYQDGAFFTPGFITMYMCRESLRRATVQKFRESPHFQDFDSDVFSDLSNYLSRRYKSADLAEANALINNLKICDPAVGSGHFLVSALNELLTIKSELGILCDRQGKPLPVRVEVANDELSVQWSRNDELFTYRPGVQEIQLVQEALFHEKQTLIENCLFGVDINPNSAKICRLRLWIELLKNAYYKNPDELETLPNIDINIKQGNSLVSRFSLQEDLQPVLRQNKWNISDYRLAVAGYHSAREKTDKRSLLEHIERIKNEFQTHIHQQDPRFKLLSRLRGQKFVLENKAEIGNLFEKIKEADIAGDIHQLETQIAKAESEIEQIRSSAIFRNAFEWRFEFPEVLDEDGNFTGFDVVMGNPPYIRQEEFSDLKPYLKTHFQTFAGTADLLVYFIERSDQLLRPNGQFSFIISNKFMRAGFGKNLREWLAKRRILEIIDFGDLPVFEEATTYPCILSWEKNTPLETFRAANVPALHIEDFQTWLPSVTFNTPHSSLVPEGWTLANAEVQQLLEKLRRSGTPLGEYVHGKIFRGVLTGFNEAFVIDEATKNRLVAEDPNSATLIKPFLAGRDIKRYQQPKGDRYLIFTRRGINIEEYPAIKAHLTQFRTQLEPRPSDWKGKSDDWPGRKPGTYKWYEIQDSVDYYEEFEKEKIIYQEISTFQSFAKDYSGLYCNNKIFMLPLAEDVLLGVLNSKVTWFYLNHIATKYQGGAIAMQSPFVLSIPIPNFRAEEQSRIEELVKEINTIKSTSPSSDTTPLESEIDRLVYGLYGLTEAEIALIEGKGIEL